MASVYLLQDDIVESLRKIGWGALSLSFLSMCLIYCFVSYKPARFCFFFVAFLVFVIAVFCLSAGSS